VQSSLRRFRDWGMKQLRRNAYMCVNFKLEYILTLRHNHSRADLINLVYFLSLWCLRKFMSRLITMGCKGAEDVKWCYKKQVTCVLCDFFLQWLCILTLNIHWFNSFQSINHNNNNNYYYNNVQYINNINIYYYINKVIIIIIILIIIIIIILMIILIIIIFIFKFIIIIIIMMMITIILIIIIIIIIIMWQRKYNKYGN